MEEIMKEWENLQKESKKLFHEGKRKLLKNYSG
jgi:hypothetical protein